LPRALLLVCGCRDSLLLRLQTIELTLAPNVPQVLSEDAVRKLYLIWGFTRTMCGRYPVYILDSTADRNLDEAQPWRKQPML